ncbi:hypothetical protein A6V39_03530 [Candidatus Mycoplasma haematobovis]|uniref:Uncharacterized protein n=1 Tax=Candidatus Mycoplasma haematobovis TaxID=432608 RepID=A0A1A9QBW6_9MOLU|nr:hypothetical protein [Candidatus Mycoplasma haematobovis]OAL09957.1 hypothetical protein A6V39_03530 [Candidatus Mycoplasma haematobovis]
MNIPAKVGISLGALSGVGGLGYIVQQQLTTSDISSKLIKEDYELLEDNAIEWAEILVSYKATVGTNTKLKFEGFESTTSTNELPRLCKEATKVDLAKDTDGAIYERAKKWCTKPRTLENLLDAQGKRFLDTDSKTDNEQEKWNEKLDAHNSAGTSNTNKFSQLDLLTSGSLQKNPETRNKLKEKCASLKNKKHHEKDFEKELRQAELWCSTDK